MYSTTCGITLKKKKAKGDWMQGDLQESGRCPVLKMLW